MNCNVLLTLRSGRWQLALALLIVGSGPVLVASPTLADPSPMPAIRNADAQSIENLDTKTLAMMRAQEKLQPAVQVIGDEHMNHPDSGYAGIAFEGNGLTLYWKGSLTTGMRAAIDRARSLGPVTVKPARHSYSELHGEADRIHKAITLHGASEIQSISYPADGSGLYIERAPASLLNEIRTARAKAGRSAPATAEQILSEAQLSVPVRMSTAPAPFTFTATRLADSAPWNGGDKFEVYHRSDGSYRGTCTTGFGVHASGRSWILTAAHCASIGDDAYQATTMYMGPVNSDQWAYDLLLIDTLGWHVIFDGAYNTSNTKDVNSWGYWVANELVCQSGSTSGTVCDIKEGYSTDVILDCGTPDSDGDCGYTMYGLIHSTQIDGLTPARSGDSGGPVFTLDGAGVRAKGITSGVEGTAGFYFQDWSDVIRLFGAYPNTVSYTS